MLNLIGTCSVTVQLAITWLDSNRMDKAQGRENND